MQQKFLLQILLLAQHVLDTTMPIIKSSRVLYSGFYVKTNSPQSAYAQYILHNQYEYGALAETITILKPLQYESMLLPFEQFHIQSLHQAGQLITEKFPNDPNPLFQLAFCHPHHTRHKTEPVNHHPANRTHKPQLHSRPAT